jgi:hypothetical protein
MAQKPSVVGIGIFQYGGINLKDAAIFGVLVEVEFEPGVKYAGEPIQFEF